MHLFWSYEASYLQHSSFESGDGNFRNRRFGVVSRLPLDVLVDLSILRDLMMAPAYRLLFPAQSGRQHKNPSDKLKYIRKEQTSTRSTWLVSGYRSL